jgi:hypothetical protein
VLQEPHNSDLELMIGGELAVTAVGGFGLSGDPKRTNPFVVFSVKTEQQASNVSLETVDPAWNHQISFESIVSLNMELIVRCPIYDPPRVCLCYDAPRVGFSNASSRSCA